MILNMKITRSSFFRQVAVGVAVGGAVGGAVGAFAGATMLKMAAIPAADDEGTTAADDEATTAAEYNTRTRNPTLATRASKKSKTASTALQPEEPRAG